MTKAPTSPSKPKPKPSTKPKRCDSAVFDVATRNDAAVTSSTL